VQEDDPDAEQTQGRERQRQPEHNHRAEAPGDLGEPQQPAARLVRRKFAHQCERRRHVGANGDPDDEGADEEHLAVDRQRDQENAERIDHEVILVDAFAAQLVPQPASNKRTDRAAQGIRSDGSENANRPVAQPELLLQDGEAGAQGDN
jgi:hypothetical protein